MIALVPTPEAQNEPHFQDRDYLSWSAISTFRSCPLKFFYRYVAQVPEERRSANLVFGGAIHAALELHFQERLAGNATPTLDALMSAYYREWGEVDLASVVYSGDDDLGSLSMLAERMLTAFQASPLAQPTGSIIGIEEEVRAAILSDCPDVLGRIDLVLESADEIRIIDFKTSRCRWSASQVGESAGQLLLYGQLAENMVDDKPVRLSFAVITKTKMPDIALHDVPFDAQQLARTRNIISHVWQAITDGHFYPNPSALNCPTCPFRDRCARWTG